jgi:acetylornithine deacetylase/succinyl-diaminopimelate desuccinylase-like protein
MDAMKWDAIADEAVRHLQALLRIDTTNPPGNESAAAEYLAGVLRAEGLAPIVLESEPGRGNCIARLRGDGSHQPLLLYGHTDVVPAEPDHWTHPPFSGDVADGCIWGRGALDMKSIVVMQLMTILLLKRFAPELQRDVIFAATADEEIDSDVGAGWLIKQHPDLVRAEYGLSELGGYTLYLQGRRFYPIQTAEKGTCWLKIRASGRPGHGSVPHADNAALRLSQAIVRVASHSLPLHVTPTAAGFVQRIARSIGGLTGLTLRAALNPVLHEAAVRALPRSSFADTLRAILHNTVSPNQITAGHKVNVIPSEAEARLDGRMLPGFNVDSFLSEVRSRLGPGIQIDVEQTSPPLEVPVDTPLFKTIEQQLNRSDPGAIVLPYMLTGATDAKLFARLGTRCYGFAPMKIDPGMAFDGLIHGHDERIAISTLAFGVRVLYETVRDFCLAQM